MTQDWLHFIQRRTADNTAIAAEIMLAQASAASRTVKTIPSWVHFRSRDAEVKPTTTETAWSQAEEDSSRWRLGL